MPDDDGIDMDWLINSPDTSQWLRDYDDEDDRRHDRKVSDRGEGEYLILLKIEYQNDLR